MAKNPPTNAGDTGSILGPGGSHIAVGQLSCYTPITEAALQLLSTCAATAEAHVPRACTLQQRSPR